jgi:hypothetical protein
MGMTFVYDSKEPLGRQYSIICGRPHVIAAAMAEGLNELDAAKLLHKAHVEARGNRQSSAIRVPRAKSKRVELDGEVVANFIRDRYVPQHGSDVLFADFYVDFVAWLEPSLRSLWNRLRLSKALPADHPSIAGRGNVRFVSGLTKPPT